MLIFEYKCDECSSVFECSNSIGSVACVSCGSSDVERVDSMLFSPKKDFCPRKRSDLFGKSESKCYHKCDKKP